MDKERMDPFTYRDALFAHEARIKELGGNYQTLQITMREDKSDVLKAITELRSVCDSLDRRINLGLSPTIGKVDIRCQSIEKEMITLNGNIGIELEKMNGRQNVQDQHITDQMGVAKQIIGGMKQVFVSLITAGIIAFFGAFAGMWLYISTQKANTPAPVESKKLTR